MSNPFENNDGEYLVLVNDEGQYSLWPAYTDVPAGWHIAHEKAGRQECLDHIEAQWTDMRPRSVVRATEHAAAQASTA
ncbi:MbtH family protein [Streptomyces sp. NPDC001135]